MRANVSGDNPCKSTLFSNRELKVLILPLMIEQVLAISVGMVDTMMISYAG